MRCDSTEELYPVTKPNPQAFVSIAPVVWHQRLDHPDYHEFKKLVACRFISCLNNTLHSLCDSFQMRKHVKLPFSLSKSIYLSLFELVYSEVSTSPVTSISGIKYYVIFLDDYSHYVWIYPLRIKSDVYSKFVHFRAFILNHF